MCLAMYLFTNDDLPESQWDRSDPKAFVVAVTKEYDRDAMKWLRTQSRIYYVGSYQGCGCGWSPINEYDEESDTFAKASDRKIPADTLGKIDRKLSWFVVCWEGSQGEKLLAPMTVSLDEVKNPSFEFEELRKYQIGEHSRYPFMARI